MSTISTENAIQSLIKTVADLQCKVSSLEAVILDQNNTIRKLINVCEKSCATENQVNIDKDEGMQPPTQRQLPVRKDNDRTKSATIASARSTYQASKQSERVAAAELGRAKTATTPAATTLDAHKAVSENSTHTTHTQHPDWINVKPRRQRRTVEATTSVVGDELQQELNANGKNTNILNKKSGKITPINKGNNTSSVLRLKAVERKRYLHVWRLVSNTTENDVTDYVREILDKDSYVRVDKINPKIERDYSSFRICVSERDFEKLCNPKVWPMDAEYSEWVFFRTASRTHKEPDKVTE